MGEMAPAKRPGVVTLLGILIYIQALIAGIVAVLTFINRDDAHWQESTGQSADALLYIAIAEAVVALILAYVAMRLMNASRGARTFVGVVMVLRIGVAVWAMIAHHGGGIFGAATIQILVALFILWALYAHDASDRYFA